MPQLIERTASSRGLTCPAWTTYCGLVATIRQIERKQGRGRRDRPQDDGACRSLRTAHASFAF